MTDLTDEQLLRYSRQIMLPKFDVAGQQALLDARVLVIGLGGLGSPVAMYLASAGVGTLHLVDYDVVDKSNLQRQIIHNEQGLGLQKVTSAEQTLRSLNSEIALIQSAEKLSPSALEDAVSKADLVLDCSDNFATRYAVNRACVNHLVPLVSGAAIRMEGQVSVFDARDDGSPCYQCLYPDVGDEETMSCSEAGVMAPLVGIIGSIQAMEAIKLLSGLGEPLSGRLLMLDAMSMDWRSLKIRRDPDCNCCSHR